MSTAKPRAKKKPAARRPTKTGTTKGPILSRGTVPTWHDLILPGGAYDRRLQTATAAKSGAYAFRDASTGAVLYVGESHSNTLWKTLLRHVHAQTSFKRQGEWVHRKPETLQVAVWTTTADEAEGLETRLIAALKPSENEQVRVRTSKEAALFRSEFDSEDDFSSWVSTNVKNNPAGPSKAFESYRRDYTEAMRLQKRIEQNTLEMLRTGNLAVIKSSAAAFKKLQTLGDRMRKARTAHGWNLPDLFLIRRESRDLGLFDVPDAPSTQRMQTLRSNPGAARRPHPAALADYEDTHWGEEGDHDGEEMDVPTVTRGTRIVALGKLRSVDYETVKAGDKAPTIYRHAFDKRRPPTLAYLYDPKTRKRGGLVVAGGIYRIETRGIVQ